MIKDKSKKKIRGYKRRVKQIEEWKQKNLLVNEEMLKTMSRDYVKVWIYPFYSLSNYSVSNGYKN